MRNKWRNKSDIDIVQTGLSEQLFSITIRYSGFRFLLVIYIDYLMVGLRYDFYLGLTNVISRTSEVQASEWYHISQEWIKPYLKPTMRIFIIVAVYQPQL